MGFYPIFNDINNIFRWIGIPYWLFPIGYSILSIHLLPTGYTTNCLSNLQRVTFFFAEARKGFEEGIHALLLILEQPQ